VIVGEILLVSDAAVGSVHDVRCDTASVRIRLVHADDVIDSHRCVQLIGVWHAVSVPKAMQTHVAAPGNYSQTATGLVDL